MFAGHRHTPTDHAFVRAPVKSRRNLKAAAHNLFAARAAQHHESATGALCRSCKELITQPLVVRGCIIAASLPGAHRRGLFFELGDPVGHLLTLTVALHLEHLRPADPLLHAEPPLGCRLFG